MKKSARHEEQNDDVEEEQVSLGRSITQVNSSQALLYYYDTFLQLTLNFTIYNPTNVNLLM